MPVHGFTLICLVLPVCSILMPASSLPQHNLCQLIQTTAICNHGMLSSVPSGLPDNIEELQLNHNSIKTLSEHSLIHYRSLETLSLAGNHLETLESGAFHDSTQIECLNLAENSLHVGYQETSDALLRLPRLRVLDLSQNELDDNAASVLLQNLTSLEYLNLSRNLLLRLDESSFQGLHQLRELDLQGNMLFEIDHAFDSVPRLQRLNLAFNYLPCLQDFHMTQLVVLNASHNSIEWFISRQDLAETFHLETLDLTDNKLIFFPFLPSRSRLRNLHLSRNSIRFYEHLADNATYTNWTTSVNYYNLRGNMSNVTANLWDDSLHGDISSLDVLDMSGNQIDYFPRGFISKMPALSRLRMYTNCLEALHLTLGEFSDSLYELDVSNNRLRKIVADQSALGGLGNLTYLNLSLNDLRLLPSRLFSSLPSLRSVDLSYNPELGVCPDEDIGNDPSDCVVWKHVSSLRQLYLKGCGLERLSSSAFTGMSLTHLELSDNTGIDIPPRSIQTLGGTLQHLGLGNTDIQKFDFSPFHRLKYLDLSNNSLNHFPPSLSHTDLQVLDLRHNKLSTIPSGHANVLAPKLRMLFLTGNVFNCCQMEWYMTFERTETINMVDISNILCEDLDKRTHRVVDYLLTLSCGHEEGEPLFWYFLLVVPIFISFLGISTIFCLTFKPKLLGKTVKNKCFKPTPY